jgi:anti-sigma factor ChrR (cupin superfamily)
MSATYDKHRPEHTELVFLYALHALPPGETPAMEAHIAACADCRREMETLRPVVDSFAFWPTDVSRPSPSLWERLAERVAAETGTKPVSPAPQRWVEPEWKEVAPGISCKLLATDTERDRVSMLVRLAPGVDYPPHTHAGLEELHLLHGELWINDRKLYPGDYNRAERGTADQRVWSETGCTCVLVTSTRDVIG